MKFKEFLPNYFPNMLSFNGATLNYGMLFFKNNATYNA